jgi:hypothetical protein
MEELSLNYRLIYFCLEEDMSSIGLMVKPILEEMGLFNGTEVSVKKAFEEYLKKYPKGIGPLYAFKRIVAHDLHLCEKEVRVDGSVADFLFSYNVKDDLLYYDPRNANRQKLS